MLLIRHNQGLTVANMLCHLHPAFSPDGRQIMFCRRVANDDAAESLDIRLQAGSRRDKVEQTNYARTP